MDRIMITGASGFVGKALINELTQHNHLNLLPITSSVNLTQQDITYEFVRNYNPDIIIHLAATVGGIQVNQKNPGKFFYNNIMMGVNIIDAARIYKVKKFVQIGTVCSYPKYTPIPFQEERLWDGWPENTNAPYGIAKKALLVMLQAYRQQYNFNGIYLIPVNLYGPGDNFNSETSHVIPALIKKIDYAKTHNIPFIEIWGTGKASREFLYIDDCVRGIRLAMEKYDGPEPVNLGSGMEITIANLAEELKAIMGYSGRTLLNSAQPDGQPRRCLDTSRAKQYFGFEATTDFKEGLKKTVEWYYKQEKKDVDAA